jgi:Clp amino terminal domain, pathogenicity island component
VAQRSEQADRVLDLAREEADLLGHRYLGPEHVVLGVLRDGGSGASRVLEAHGVDLAGARDELGRLADRGVVPGPRPSDAELLGSLGVDLEAIRRATEQAFGGKALGWAIREATRVRRGGSGGCRGRRCATRRCSSARCWCTPASRPGHSASR